MFSFAAKGARAVSGAGDKLKDKHDKAGGVNWSEFNYPPCLTVVHFDPAGDAIPLRAKLVLRRCTWVWYASLCILGCNIVTNIGMVGAKAEPGAVILYAFLQLLIGMVGGFCALYQGYRGVAGDLVRSSRRYLVAQSVLTLLMVLFAVLSSGNVHGFTGITAHALDRPQPGFLLICILEGTAWMLCAVASVWVMHGVYKYPGHAAATRDAANAAAAAKAAPKQTKSATGSKSKRHAAPTAAEAEGEASTNSTGGGGVNSTGGKSKKGKGKKLPPPDPTVDDEV